MSDSRIVPATAQAIERAATLLERTSGVVAFPTETLYGLAVDALSPRAVERLVRLKGRALERAMGVLLSDVRMLGQVVAAVPRAAQCLIERHWPGPLTLVLPAVGGLSPALVNERGGVGVRVSPDPVATGLVAALGRPITATSANRSGAAVATTAADLAAALSDVSLILDDGPRGGSPSTVVDFSVERPVVLRQGALVVDLSSD